MNIKNYIQKKVEKRVENIPPEDAIHRYQNMSEEDLMQEMRRVAEQNRRNGTLNNTDLDAFYKNAQGMLTPEQLSKMKTLIEELKR